jgi:membrane protein required for colicin V production
MTIFDIGTVTVILLFGLLGLWKGVIYELFLLALSVAVFLVSYFATPYVAEFLIKFIQLDERIVFLLLFSLFTLVAFSLLGGLIALFGKVEKPTPVSRGIGMFLGLFLGVLFSGVLLWLIAIFMPSAEHIVLEGIVTKYAMSAVTATYGVLERFIRHNDITPFTIMNYKI